MQFISSNMVWKLVGCAKSDAFSSMRSLITVIHEGIADKVRLVVESAAHKALNQLLRLTALPTATLRIAAEVRLVSMVDHVQAAAMRKGPRTENGAALHLWGNCMRNTHRCTKHGVIRAIIVILSNVETARTSPMPTLEL
jgi:hypothetical protein